MLIIIHHSATDKSRTRVKGIDNNHKKRWGMISSLGYYVGYHFVITGKGEITQTRSLREEGIHTAGMNDKSIGICLTGNFEKQEPNKAQVESLYSLLDKINEMNNNIVVKKHKDFAATLCPGKNLSEKVGIWIKLNKAKSLLQKIIEMIKKWLKRKNTK